MMTEETLFDLALRTPTSERRALLDRACEGKPELRKRVETLLKADARSASLLQQAPALGATTGFDEKLSFVLGDQPGVVIGGRYQLLELIGEGGMGSVWKSQQSDPVKRLVAVKLIKAGMDSKAVLARFDAERQALAMMDHPHIARVLDGGMTGDQEPSRNEEPLTAKRGSGRPYFVMELVKGTPITTFCDERKLSLQQRLELFVPVCQAIQHAHQKGVIHRDIKPSNVLVALYDDKPVPKVIDFGIAKATGAQLTEQTLDTGLGTIVGTPEYMSPEQASLNHIDIDTRSDVYSLGVLLYELLTGTTPVDRKSLKKAALMEVLRIIREEEAPRPSTKLSTAEALPNIAANRDTEPAKLTQQIHGELDWIVMKALEKDRSRRYESANGFAADVLRYLAGEPVLAHPPSAGYRLRKFVRRHRGVVIAASLVGLVLILGMIGTTWGLLEAKRAAHEERLAKENADRKRREAEEQTALALATKNFLQRDVLRLADPGTQQQAQLEGLRYDAELKLRDVVIRAAQSIDGKFPDQPLVEAEIRMTLGFTLRGMGRADLALQQYQRARAIYTQKGGVDHADTLKCMHGLGITYAMLGRHEEAKQLFEETLNLRKVKLGAEHSDTVSSMNNLANSFTALGRYEEMLKLRLETLTIMMQKFGPDHPETLMSMTNLGTSYEAMGRQAEALKIREETLKRQKDKLGPDHPETLRSMNNLAVSYEYLDRQTEALQLREETLSLQKQKLGADHPDTLSSMHNLANSYESLGKQAEALQLREETLKWRKQKLGADHPATLMSMYNLAFSYTSLGRHAEAMKLMEETLMLYRQKLGPDHPTTLSSMYRLASIYASLERTAEALKLLEETASLQKQKLGLDHPDTLYSLRGVIEALLILQRNDEVLPRIDELLALAAKSKAAGKQLDPEMIPRLLAVRFTQLMHKKDLARCRSTAEQYEKLPPTKAEQFYDAAYYRSMLADMLKAVPEEARTEADRAMAWLQKAVSAGYKDCAQVEKLEPLLHRNDFKKLLESLRQRVEKK